MISVHQITVTIGWVCDVDNRGWLALSKQAIHVSSEARCEGHRCYDLVPDKVRNVLIIRSTQGVTVFTVRLLWQQNHPIQSAKMI